ncbi:MAG TPA: D-alanyl-D-alanine carboxypeptidase [Trebonia sp.]|nr:D-alanyl-D-alanine carboxypeptidase [Trebonia sp.]
MRTRAFRVPLAVIAACSIGGMFAAASITTQVKGTLPASAAELTSVPGPSSPIGGPLLAATGQIVNYSSPAAPRLPSIDASAFVVADAGTGAILAARDPHGRYLPASTLKMLTAVTLLPVLQPHDTTVATSLAAAAEPMSAGLVPGQRYKVSDLFTALLTISANDAAVALAQATGSYSRGIALMNATAVRLQARDTHVVDPNGLNAPGQFTSAYDLALIARQAVAMPAFLHYDQIHSASFPIQPGRSETLYNQNRLLHDYPGGLGGKIGWTSAAGATYVGLARRGGVTLIVTLLHCPSLTEIGSAERLLDWGFAAHGKVRPVGALVAPLQPAPRLASRPAYAAGSGAMRADAVVRMRSGRAAASGPLPSVRTIVAASFTALTILVIAVAVVATRRQRLWPPGRRGFKDQ